MLNTFHLRTFVSVADAGSYSAAAALLHLSQPAVSQHIRALEEQLDGVRLFRRVGKKMVATHAGEELLGTARELVTLATRAEESIRALKGQLGGRVTLGCTPSSGERLLAPLLTAFRRRFPSVALEVLLAPAQILLEWLLEQQVDVLLVEEQQRRRNWESFLLGREPLLLLAPRGHPFLQQEQVPPGALREQPLIMPRAGAPLRRAIEEALRRRGVPSADLKVTLECDSIALAVQGVRAGMGLAFVPQSRQPRARDVGVVSLAGIGIQQEWYALRSRDGSSSQARDEPLHISYRPREPHDPRPRGLEDAAKRVGVNMASKRSITVINIVIAGALVVLLALAELLQLFGSGAPAAEDTAAGAVPLIRFGGGALSYTPGILSVPAGSTVEWRGSLAQHPLISVDGLWQRQASGDVFSYTFATPGTYRYYCQIHGGATGGMTGDVVVE